jgi:predicted RNase H-like nuclease
VFSAVGRAALQAGSHADADAISRSAGGIGIGAQAWGLAEKLKEADGAMTPEGQRLVRDVHPEVSFWAMNGHAPLPAAKKSLEGMLARMDALESEGFPSTFVRQLPLGFASAATTFSMPAQRFLPTPYHRRSS